MADHGRLARRRRDFARTQEELLCAAAQTLRALPLALFAAWFVPEAARAQTATLTLEQAIESALAHNEVPRTAEQRVRAAEARADRARSLFLPDLTATGSYLIRPDPAERILPTGDSLQQDRDVWSGAIGLNVNLLDPRAFPLNSQAHLERDAARLTADETLRTLAFEVARAYIAVLGVEQVQRAAEQRVWLAGRIMDGARGRFDAGLASSNDVTLAELERASAQRELASSSGQVRSARLELGYLIGAEVRQTLVAPPAALDATLLAKANPEALTRVARARRKDLAAASKRTDALDSAADEPLARWFPSLALNGQYRVTTEEFFGRHDEITAGLLLTWALWDGGERSADRDERVALALASELETDALSRRIGTDVRQALNQLERGQAEAVEADAAASAARKNMVETRELYSQGLLQSLAVADAALRLFSAEVELVRARYGIATALLDLRAALGLDPFGKEPR